MWRWGSRFRFLLAVLVFYGGSAQIERSGSGKFFYRAGPLAGNDSSLDETVALLNQENDL
jgi:hypothetical protein